MKSILLFMLQIANICICQSCKCGIQRISTRISGGVKVLNEESYPWMAFLSITKNNGAVFNCGGSIINEKYMLTAAHCLEDAVKVNFAVGSILKPTSAQLTEAESFIVHERYTKTTKKNDIALIKLKVPLSLSNKISPICLPNKGEIASGWGVTPTGFTTQLLEINVDEFPGQQCADSWGGLLSTKTQICVGNEKQNACKGDSGGPLMSLSQGKYTVAGVASHIKSGQNCGISGDTVYLRVEPYLDWIATNTADSKNCFT
ncbi:Transmembrane protease serine 9-like protein [Leptotrombidium deliense]|uniref:Transmembrane protease serine 9-like protein n=1 Tax=Leptotrombidium deliense TaxID=299467 RepID=A0A443SD93_9ACAR|nr:Transmembrane protease serine 9-like protein [Leptotrombidium deliense]